MGISVGSFLNVVADRVPRKQSIVSPPSHCFNCGHNLAWNDMIPVISYLALQGKCRYCRASITPRSLVFECITGLLFILAWLRFGAGIQLLAVIIYASILIVLIITDLENQKMPGTFIYFSIILFISLAAAHIFIHVGPDLTGSIEGFAAGFGLLALAWLMLRWSGKHNIGPMSVWTGGLIGSSIGFPAIMPAIVAALLVSALMAAIIWLIKKRGPERAPFMAVFSCVALIILYCGEYFPKIWPF